MTAKDLSIATVWALALAACSPAEKKETAPADEAGSTGWKVLFDGTTLNGWRTFKNLPNDSWEVSDGTLHCKPFNENGENKRADLITEEQFENFELELEWKISPQGNSGIMFRVSEEFEQPYLSGPEYQVLDDLNYPGEVKPTNMTASNYDMHVAEGKVLKPVGEWNLTKIVVNGNSVEHWLNGNKVLSYELGSADWQARKDSSKWKEVAGYGASARGHICLQDHGNEVWYRNIKIRSL